MKNITPRTWLGRLIDCAYAFSEALFAAVFLGSTVFLLFALTVTFGA